MKRKRMSAGMSNFNRKSFINNRIDRSEQHIMKMVKDSYLKEESEFLDFLFTEHLVVMKEVIVEMFSDYNKDVDEVLNCYSYDSLGSKTEEVKEELRKLYPAFSNCIFLNIKYLMLRQCDKSFAILEEHRPTSKNARLFLLTCTHRLDSISRMLGYELKDVLNYEMNNLVTKFKTNLYKVCDRLGIDGSEEDLEIVEDAEECLDVSYNYIGDYKDLNRLAESNGFVFNRQAGDHAHYKNSEGYIVTIPQGRVVGKGLSICIQKQITNPSNYVV